MRFCSLFGETSLDAENVQRMTNRIGHLILNASCKRLLLGELSASILFHLTFSDYVL